MEMAKVIVDSRERNQELIEALERNGCSLVIETLPVGDYLISDRIAIERKTVPDFESSIINGRLFEQLDNRRKNYEAPILLLEGNKNNFKFDKNVINGTIAAIYSDYNIIIISTEDSVESAELIAAIANREQNGKAQEPSMKGIARARSDRQFQEFVVGNLPGVGPKLARSLLNHFGSINRLANADVEQLMEVEKIGQKKAEAINNVFNRLYREDDR